MRICSSTTNRPVRRRSGGAWPARSRRADIVCGSRDRLRLEFRALTKETSAVFVHQTVDIAVRIVEAVIIICAWQPTFIARVVSENRAKATILGNRGRRQ